MNKELRMLINNLTQDIIELFQIQIPITDINDVVNKLGGHIKEDFNIVSISDGSIRKQGDGFVIFVSPFQSIERKNFTIAHELGHLFLHMGYMIDSELWEQQNETYYRSGDSLKEYQANEFAAALLMPEKQYKKIMDQYTIEDNVVETSKIASYFKVSVSAASNRGKFLGYLEW